MTTVDYPCDDPTAEKSASITGKPHSKSESQAQRMHRLRSVRLQQGVSLRTVARQTGTDIRQLRLQEQETTDIRLSDLHKWQEVLEVPLNELIAEPGTDLSQPVMERAQMVRLMKTAAAMLELAESPRMQRMAQMLVEQLIEIMPELKDVGPWHSYGQRRGLNEYGRVMDQPFSVDMRGWDDDD